MDNQSWENYATKSPVHAKLWERYRSLGLEGEQINELLKIVTDDQDLKRAWLLTLAQLRHQLPVVAGDLIESGGVYSFLGATGVGKTTSIGKLATRFVLNHGADSVALVTTDRYRIAAHEQLQILNTAKQSIKSVLVLSATSQIEVQRAELNAYSSLDVKAGIITKTDEAVSLGGSLGLFATNRIPVAHEAFGQSIPDDIAAADAQQLINKAVLISRHKPINKEQMVAGFNTTFTNTGYKERHAASVR